jgi:hypothetical protein
MKYFLTLVIVAFNFHSSLSQVSEPKFIDSVFKNIREIKTILDNSATHKEEIKNFKNQFIIDSLDLEKNKKTIQDLTIALEKFKDEKVEFSKKTRQFQDSLKNFQSEYSSIADNQIETLLNQKFDKTGSLPVSREVMTSMLSLAQKSTSKKINQLKAYIDVYDSVISVRKIFEKEYDMALAQQAKKSIASIEISIKNKLSNTNAIEKEVSNLKKLVDGYCQNTYELFFSLYKKSGMKPTMQSNIDPHIEKTAFRVELEGAYFLAFQYPYLLKVLNQFKDDPAYREQFKNKHTFTCN